MRGPLRSFALVVFALGLLSSLPSAAHDSLRERIDAFVRAEQNLGPAGPLILAKREVKGDDRVYTYLVQFGTVTYRYCVSLIPDGRVSAFELREN
ncbi:hypothetical protein F0U60_12570 [Archangium minus]|uniref:PepSY domain-containing protein n=1 Tax=Archangium minus TaxID=83450 RepID=A0ABY9WNK2_9BACT|nr:hypothetical protein F0U60_12570 [Archangium minus]